MSVVGAGSGSIPEWMRGVPVNSGSSFRIVAFPTWFNWPKVLTVFVQRFFALPVTELRSCIFLR